MNFKIHGQICFLRLFKTLEDQNLGYLLYNFLMTHNRYISMIIFILVVYVHVQG